MRGLNTKLGKLFDNISTCSYDVLAFSETWLGSNIANQEILDNNSFTIFRSDRDRIATARNRGGGVMLAVNSKLNAFNLNLHNGSFGDLPFIDVIGVKIWLEYYFFYIFTIYIPPDTSTQQYHSIYDAFSSLNLVFNSDLLILGDFNIPDYCSNLNSVSHNVQALLNFQHFLGLSQFNNVKNNRNRLLDIVLCNKECVVERAADVLIKEDLHHPALTIFLNIRNKHENHKVRHNLCYTYNFRKANFPLLYQMLFEVDWDFLSECQDIDYACDKFYSKLNSIIDICVPKTVSPKNVYPPWFDKELIKNIKLKHKAWQNYKDIGDVNSYNKFKEIRQKVKFDTEKSHKNYAAFLESNINLDPSAFWRYVNFKRKSDLPKSMIFENETISDPQLISNLFADYFQQSYNKPDPPCNSFDFNLDTSNNSYLNIRSFSEAEVSAALKKLKPKLTSGPDNVPSFVLRDCPVLAKPLTILYNLSLKTAKFPSLWKHSKIIPVYKKGERKEISNYRPIVIINNSAKVFEIVLYEHLFSHVKHQITSYQHGFYKGRSTVTNLFCITDYLSEAIDDGLQTDIIYTDFSKAFDRLDHNILLQKLLNFGLSKGLIQFFTSYLSNRIQNVLYCGCSSVDVLPTSGVPQGSNLGPLLFNIFINDIVANLTINCLLYADDLKLYSRISSQSDCEILQQNLNCIDNWCVENKLSLNVTKCNVLSVATKQHLIIYDYRLNNVTLYRPEIFCDLGVHFDRKLSFVPHINYVIAKAYRILGFVIRNSALLNNGETMKLLYFAYVRSNLEYASIIWCPYYTAHIENLEQIQRRFLKFAAFRIDGTYPAIGFPQAELLSRFSISSLSDRRKVSYLIFLYKIIHNVTDCTQILSMLNFFAHRSVSRQPNLFYHSTPRTNLRKYSPLYTMCNLYNEVQFLTDIFSCSIASLKRLI